MVLAILALVASVAGPVKRSCELQAQREAALQDLKELQAAVNRYAAAQGGYPAWGELDLLSLTPLAPTHAEDPAALLAGLRDQRLDFYAPHRGSRVGSRDSEPDFIIIATLAQDPNLRFAITRNSIRKTSGSAP
jgi:hypothetical protein